MARAREEHETTEACAVQENRSR